MNNNNFSEFIKLVATLRGENGCPWDKKQTLYSMKDDFIEEAYELINALDNKDIENTTEELGDILLHVVLHSQIAAEEGLFDINDVVDGISSKIIRRHPHVFGADKETSPEKAIARWEAVKKLEKAATGVTEQNYLDKVHMNQPAVNVSTELQQKAAKAGFDWDNVADVLAKVDEELAELKNAIKHNDSNEVTDELGDLLFAIINLSRHLKISAEGALRGTNAKFIKRFNYIESELAKAGITLEDATLDEMEALWIKAKKL